MELRAGNVSGKGRVHDLLVSAYRGLAKVIGGTRVNQTFPLNHIERAFRARMRVRRTEIDGQTRRQTSVTPISYADCAETGTELFDFLPPCVEEEYEYPRQQEGSHRVISERRADPFGAPIEI